MILASFDWPGGFYTMKLTRGRFPMVVGWSSRHLLYRTSFPGPVRPGPWTPRRTWRGWFPYRTFGQNHDVAIPTPTSSSSVSTTLAASSSPWSTSSTATAAWEDHIQQLFAHKKCQIHEYWKEALLQCTRPAAQSLVMQLDASAGCPMGYDPAAQPMNTWTAVADGHPLGRPEGSETDEATLTTTTTTTTTRRTKSTAGRKGSFLDFCRQQKKRYPDCILLTRCGDFYETFGMDAIMLVEHCSLNPMAGKAKAGCPIRNVQHTLDCLTSAGFRVAVYEEGPDTTESVHGSSSSKARLIKGRFLSQVVSSASPTYLYDWVLMGRTEALAQAPPSRPYVGILSQAQAGYTLVQIDAEERQVRVWERLTAAAVACRLAANPPADPLWIVPTPEEYRRDQAGWSLSSWPFLPSAREMNKPQTGTRLRTRILPPDLVDRQTTCEVERAKNMICAALLQLTESPASDRGDSDEEEEEQDDLWTRQGHRYRRVSVEDFTLVSTYQSTTGPEETHTQPLYMETATQLGLMDDPTIPSIIPFLVTPRAPMATKRFFRRWLLTPPPPTVGQAMSTLVSFLKDEGPALPPLTIPPVGKVLALLRAGQASAQVYGELLRSLAATVTLVEQLRPSHPAVLQALMVLLEYEGGLAADPLSLRVRCRQATAAMEDIISPVHHAASSPWDINTLDDSARFSDTGGVLPASFVERNEETWRGRVRRSAVPEAYAKVDDKAQALVEAVRLDFGSNPPDLVQDIFDNLIALKSVPPNHHRKSDFIHPKDRNGKILRNRYTTERVQLALSDYVVACEVACQNVTAALVGLSDLLHDQGHIPAIVQAAHLNLIVSSAHCHAARANALGWNMASTFEATSVESTLAGSFVNLWPYWMDRSEAIPNTFELEGMWILTAPNMSGKSTLMRAIASSALLTICGLCAPLSSKSSIRRFDHIFVRGASADVPVEQKSAFGAEMADVAALLRCCGEKSLVFVDELGRGTSPRDGTRLAGAVLEAMATAGMSGVFATHLHDIFKLPLRGLDRIVRKRMAIHESDDAGAESAAYKWTYRLQDGVCMDSMALLTAERFGLPSVVIERARTFEFEKLPEQELLRSTDGRSKLRPNTRTRKQSMEFVMQIAEDLTGLRGISIPPQWSAPASLNGKSCAYILKLNVKPARYYVGETDNLANRLEQHRAKNAEWSHLEAIAFPAAAGKSQARAWESQLIQKLAQAGVELVSTKDGRSIRTVSFEREQDQSHM